MAILNESLDLISSLIKFREKGYSSDRYGRIIRVIASMICMLVLSQRYLNMFEFERIVQFPLWDKQIRDWFDGTYKKAIIVWILFDLFWSKVVGWISVYLEENGNEYLRPWLGVIGDLVNFFSTIIYLGEAINVFIYYQNRYFPISDFKFLFQCAFFHLGALIVTKIFNENYNFWIRMDREYLEYFDCKGRNLYIGASVIYYKKRYEVIEVKKGDFPNKELLLYNQMDRESIDLKQAVKNKDGELTIMYWRRGSTIDNMW